MSVFEGSESSYLGLAPGFNSMLIWILSCILLCSLVSTYTSHSYFILVRL